MGTFSAFMVLCEGNPLSPVDSPHNGQWRGALMFSLMWARANVWANNRDAGDLRRNCAHHDVIVMIWQKHNSRVRTKMLTNSAQRHLLVIKWKHFPRYWPFVQGNSSVNGEFPSQRPVTRSFDVVCDLRLNKQLSKQSWGWWFGTPSRSL